MKAIIHFGAAHDDLTLLDKRLRGRGLTFDLQAVTPSKRGRILKAVSEDFSRNRELYPSTVSVLERYAGG